MDGTLETLKKRILQAKKSEMYSKLIDLIISGDAENEEMKSAGGNISEY